MPTRQGSPFYLLFLMGCRGCRGWQPVCWPWLICLLPQQGGQRYGGLLLTPATILLPWVLSNQQEPEAPPSLNLAGLGPICFARLCAVVASTCSACLVFLSGGLSVSHSSPCGGYLSCSSLFLSPSLLSWNLWGCGSDLCLFSKASKEQAGPEAPMFASVCPGFPPVSTFFIPASQYCLCACSVPLCLCVHPSYLSWPLLWPCSSVFVLCFSPSSLAPLCLVIFPRSWTLGPCQFPS